MGADLLDDGRGTYSTICSRTVFGYKNPVPFAQSDRLLPALVPLIVWSATGFYMLLFLAAMENIPEEFYEAARLDGAGQFTLFRAITLPLIWEVLVTGIIFLIIGGLKIFDVIWVMENGRPGPVDAHAFDADVLQASSRSTTSARGQPSPSSSFCSSLAATLLSRRALRRDTLEY